MRYQEDIVGWGADELVVRLMPDGDDQPTEDVGGDGVEDEDADV